MLLGIELILASPIYETSPSDVVESTTITTTEGIDFSTEIPVSSEKSEDLKGAETGLGFIGIGVPIYGGYYPRRHWGGYGGWGGGYGYGGWGGGYGHHHGHWGGHHHGHFGHGHGHWRG